MVRGIYRHIGYFLLIVLAWSCFGLNIGMIGHEAVRVDMAHEDPSAVHRHACCGATETSTDANTAGAHQVNATLVKWMNVLPPIVFLLPVALAHLFAAGMLVVIHILLRWQTRWRWRADLFVRLFSRGILHAKTW